MKTAARTVFLMAVLTLISKLFGFVREMIIANFYGASYITDAYVMAITIPTIIFSGIWGSVAVAYMPVFSDIIEKEGNDRANVFTNSIISILLFVSILSSIAGLIFSEQIVDIFAKGFEGETAELTIFYVKVTLSYVAFTSIAAVLESNLQYKGIFLPQIIIGYFQNLVIIAAIIISVYTSTYFLIFGWLLAYILRFLFLAVLANRKGHHYSVAFNLDSRSKTVISLALPIFIGSSMSQIGIFVDKTLASGLPEGSVSALNYANLLIGLITGLTVTILTTVIYPKLAQANSLEDHNRFSDILSTGINLIIIITVPFSLGAILYSKPIVQLIYERGAFDAAATGLTASAFLFYAIGLLFTSLNTLMTQGFFSMRVMKAPVVFSMVGVIIDIVLNLVLVRPMAHNGLALATSIAAISNTILFFLVFKYKYPSIRLIRSGRKVFYIIISAIISVSVSLPFFKWVNVLLDNNYIEKAFVFMFTVILASTIYLGLLLLFKIEEIKLIKQIFKK